MALLVHLFDARNERSLKRSGIRGGSAKISLAGKCVELDRAVFCMPVLPNYFATHQWLRELKRSGVKTIAAARFRLRSDARVFVGHYNGEHRLVQLGHAVGLVMAEADPRGWEIVVPASIAARAVVDIRAVSQVVGWRYHPQSHEQGPWKCLCEYCLADLRGQIKSRRLVAKLRKSAPPPEPPIQEGIFDC